MEELYLWMELITISSHKKGLDSDTQTINILQEEVFV